MVVAEERSIITKQAAETDGLLETVHNQVHALIKASVESCKSNLMKENANLKEEINDLKKFLSKYKDASFNSQGEVFDKLDHFTQEVAKTCKPKAKPKEKETKPPKLAKSNPEESLPVDVRRLDFRIGQILLVEKHPDADSLYIEKIEVDEPQPRTVVSGLVNHMPAEDLQGRMVVLLCNLKPAKMRGITSEAMVMCASTPEKVELLIPPEGCVPGDVVEFEGYPRNSDAVLNPKRKIFETCALDLKTNDDCIATYRGVPFIVNGKGSVISKTLANVQIK